MNTARAAAVTKSGNPLRDKSRVELALRVMPPATDTCANFKAAGFEEVAV